MFTLLKGVGFAQDAAVYTSPSGQCQLRLEASPQWNTLRLRVPHPSCSGCIVTREAMAAALGAAFTQARLPQADNGYASLSIGRLMEYPWLSLFVAQTASKDPQFDLSKGAPREKDINRYVADLLGREEVLKPLSEALEESGYQISGVSVEKVLVGRVKDIPGYQGEPFAGRAPFDAQVWYRIKLK